MGFRDALNKARRKLTSVVMLVLTVIPSAIPLMRIPLPPRPREKLKYTGVPVFVPNVPKVRGFGETFQYARGGGVPWRVSKVWPKPVILGTL